MKLKLKKKRKIKAVWSIEKAEDLAEVYGYPGIVNDMAKEFRKQIDREILNGVSHYFTWEYSSPKREIKCSQKCKLKDRCCTYCKYNQDKFPNIKKETNSYGH